jgi:hypothetical protein
MRVHRYTHPMQLTSLKRTIAATALFVSLATITTADTFSFPHALEQNGVLVGIAWDLKGGQPAILGTDAVGKTILGNRDMGATFSLYDPGPMLPLLCDLIDGNPRSESFRVVPLPQTTKDLNLPNSFDAEVVGRSMELPACDVQSKDPAGVHITAAYRRLFTGQTPASNTGLDRLAAKKQKLWTPANFRISFNGKLLPNVMTVDPIKLSATMADVDGDGKPDVQVDSSAIVFTLPGTDAGDFNDAFLKAQAGAATTLPIEIDYLDDNGSPLLSLIEYVVVTSVGPAAITQTPGDPSSPVQVVCEKKGLNAVNVKKA